MSYLSFTKQKLSEYQIINSEFYYVFTGCSSITKKLIRENILTIDYLFDNNLSHPHTKCEGKQIISIEMLKNNLNYIIVVLGNHTDTLLDQFKNLSIKNTIIHLQDYSHVFYKISHDYFATNHPIAKKKELFKNIVSHIEIEPHSYCNRTCWFCPNSFIDRKKDISFFDKDIFAQLLNDLASINYDKTIAFTRYSEPFAHETFFESLKLVRKHLPSAVLHANSNADFLNNDTLQKAYSNGLNSLFIQIYLDEHEAFNLENVHNKANKIKKRLSDVQIKLLQQTPEWIEYSCIYKDMIIKMYARNFKINGINRGGLTVKKDPTVRTSPCLLVFTDVYIDYNASIVPCCNIRSDNPDETHMQFGCLTSNKNSIFDIYFSKLAISWRKSLFNFDIKTKPPCATCSFAHIDCSTYKLNHIYEFNLYKKDK